MKRLLIPVFLFGIATLFLLSCQKELSQESNINNATFSLLNDSTLTCLDTVAVNGDYYNGVAARDVNFITVVVNVKTTGNYTIASTDKNGFYFSDSGFFSRIGLDTLVLKMKGRPILIQLTDFTFGDTTCPFQVDVQDSTGTGLGGVDTSGSGANGSYSASYVDPDPASDGTWHFTDSTNNRTYSGTTIPATFVSVENLNQLSIGGYESSITNTLFAIGISMPTTTIQAGSYQLDAASASFSYSDDLQSAITDYIGIGSTDKEATDPSFVNITYDESSKRLKGSFRCWAQDKDGNPALVKGSFNTTKL